jgi:hypothetical protein
MSNLLNKFLEQRALIDRSPVTPAAPSHKEERNVMEKPRPSMETVRDLIDAKPSKKAVMDFLKRKVAQYTDTSSDD